MGKLFETLCSLSTLHNSWKSIKIKKSAGGVDGVTVASFEANLQQHLIQLVEELKNGSWKPEPYLRIEIKKNETENRPLGLLSIKDKIVQHAIKELIEPRFEKLFLGNSYGYRPHKGHTRAVSRTLSEVKKQKSVWLLKLDIDNYFDTVNHETLFARLKAVVPDVDLCRLIELCVKMGVVNKALAWDQLTQGVPQGAILSPLLSNLYLHSFDQFVVSKTGCYVRYADDFVLFFETKEAGEQFLIAATTFLETRLQLTLNEPRLVEVKTGFEFLGITFSKTGLSLSEKKESSIHEKIAHLKLEKGQLCKKSKEALAGIHRYYATLLPQVYLQKFDTLLIDKIKLLIVDPAHSISNKGQVVALLNQVYYFADANSLNKKQLLNQFVDHYLAHRSEKVAPKNKPVIASKVSKKSNTQLINQRKLEYQKRENEASELIVTTIGSYIGKNYQGIVVRLKGKIISEGSSKALKHISVISKEISISGHAIAYCMEHQIPIDFFDGKGTHLATVINPIFTSNTLWQKQTSLTHEQKAALACTLIYGKIKNQLNLIKYYHKYHKESTTLLTAKYAEVLPKLEKLAVKVKKTVLKDLLYQKTVMGIEATASVYYWDYVRTLLSDDRVNFENRDRKGADDLVNSLLNYGYALLYPRVWQALLGAKLNPMYGVLHVPQSGKPTFVYDVIELFRSQAVDRVVISLIQRGMPLGLENKLLNESSKKLLIQTVFERLNRHEKYRGEEHSFATVIKLQAKEIAHYISGESNCYRPYIAKW